MLTSSSLQWHSISWGEKRNALESQIISAQRTTFKLVHAVPICQLAKLISRYKVQELTRSVIDLLSFVQSVPQISNSCLSDSLSSSQCPVLCLHLHEDTQYMWHVKEVERGMGAQIPHISFITNRLCTCHILYMHADTHHTHTPVQEQRGHWPTTTVC